jgi:uroporphyrinogen decarboxylase
MNERDDVMTSALSLPPDRMTPAERMRALLTPGQQPDRVPFIPFATDFAGRNCGVPAGAIRRDARAGFLAQVRTQEQFGYDGGPSFALGVFGAWEFGGELRFPVGEQVQAPSVARYPVIDENDVDRLRMPDDVLTAGIVPAMLEFSHLQDRSGRGVTVQLGSVFTSAANLVDLSTFLRWMMKRPDLAHHLLRLTADFFIRLAMRWADLFPGRTITAFDGGPTEANALISPAHFREFALHYAQEVHEKALAMGITRFHTHACGEQNGNLAAYRELEFGRPGGPPGMISFGHEVQLADAIEAVGDRVIVAGNVNPTLLQIAPPEAVWEASRDAVLAGKDAPLGFVLMSGCSVPIGAVPYNVFTMLKAAKAFGQYG